MPRRKPKTALDVFHKSVHDIIEDLGNGTAKVDDIEPRLKKAGFNVWPGTVHEHYVSPKDHHTIQVLRKPGEDWRVILARLAGKLCEAAALVVLFRDKPAASTES